MIWTLNVVVVLAPIVALIVVVIVYALTRRRIPIAYHPAEALVLALLAVIVTTHGLDAQHDYYHLPLEAGRDIARTASLMGLLALGAGVVIISGGIDLSAGAMVAFSGAVFAATLALLADKDLAPGGQVPGWTVLAASSAALGAGLAVGSLHAWLITVVRLPPFIATLATLVGLRSLARSLLVQVNDGLGLGKIAQIYLYDNPEGWISWFKDAIGFRVALLLGVAILLAAMLRLTVLGRHLYALGGNEQAARLSGVRTDAVKWTAYLVSAVLASVVGIITVCDETAAAPESQGLGGELFAIAASVVGGCSLAGGIGTVTGIVLGAVFLRVVIDGIGRIIDSGANLYEGMILGIVLVMAVTSGQFAGLVGQGRRLFPGWLGVVMIGVFGLGAGLLSLILLPPELPRSMAGGVGLVVSGLAATTMVLQAYASRRRARLLASPKTT